MYGDERDTCFVNGLIPSTWFDALGHQWSTILLKPKARLLYYTRTQSAALRYDDVQYTMWSSSDSRLFHVTAGVRSPDR